MKGYSMEREELIANLGSEMDICYDLRALKIKEIEDINTKIEQLFIEIDKLM
jgi:hypothetical protein